MKYVVKAAALCGMLWIGFIAAADANIWTHVIIDNQTEHYTLKAIAAWKLWPGIVVPQGAEYAEPQQRMALHMICPSRLGFCREAVAGIYHVFDHRTDQQMGYCTFTLTRHDNKTIPSAQCIMTPKTKGLRVNIEQPGPRHINFIAQEIGSP